MSRSNPPRSSIVEGIRQKRSSDVAERPAPARRSLRRKLAIKFAAVSIWLHIYVSMFGLAVGLQALILKSPFGRTMLAIRENERRARFLGLPVERHIWLAFSISCFFIAFAGTLFALVNNFAAPPDLNYVMSGNIVMCVVMGGMRAFWGPLVGAVLFVLLKDYVSSMTTNWMSFVGLAFVLVVLFFPRGLMGFLQQRRTDP